MCQGTSRFSFRRQNSWKFQAAIMQLQNYKQRILLDPCYKIPLSVFRLRQAQFKVRSLQFWFACDAYAALISNVNRTSINAPKIQCRFERILIFMRSRSKLRCFGSDGNQCCNKRICVLRSSNRNTNTIGYFRRTGVVPDHNTTLEQLVFHDFRSYTFHPEGGQILVRVVSSTHACTK